MRQLFDNFFIGYLLIWVIVRLCRILIIPISWLNDYLTDFIFIPATAHFALQVMRKFVVWDATYRLPLSYVLFFALYASFILEWLAPKFSGGYTSDWGDVAAYFLGSLFYYYVHQGREISKDYSSAEEGNISRLNNA